MVCSNYRSAVVLPPASLAPHMRFTDATFAQIIYTWDQVYEDGPDSVRKNATGEIIIVTSAFEKLCLDTKGNPSKEELKTSYEDKGSTGSGRSPASLQVKFVYDKDDNKVPFDFIKDFSNHPESFYPVRMV